MQGFSSCWQWIVHVVSISITMLFSASTIVSVSMSSTLSLYLLHRSSLYLQCYFYASLFFRCCLVGDWALPCAFVFIFFISLILYLMLLWKISSSFYLIFINLSSFFSTITLSKIYLFKLFVVFLLFLKVCNPNRSILIVFFLPLPPILIFLVYFNIS